MINLDKIKTDAEAAAKLDHNECRVWYSESEILNDGCYYKKNAIHIANCDPQTILKLLEVVDAARKAITFYENFGYVEVAELDDTLKALDEA